MATYGITKYGALAPDGLYTGVTNEPSYRVEPFTCASYDYKSILVSWTKPLGTIFAYRLIRNRYGYPADQNDGQILVDSLVYPGSSFRDTSAIPGQYHYYSFFVQINQGSDTWVKAGVTACLAIQDFGQYQWLQDRLPVYFTNAAANGTLDELTADPTGNLFLLSFLKVIAFGLNYLKTQYNTYTQVNNPWQIPLGDLYNLSKELGLVVNPDISAYTLRKAVFYNAVINEQRGTVAGLEQEISALTGWNSDLRVAQNMMLENDQSAFLDPVYPAWSANITYIPGEGVIFGNYVYSCIALGNLGHSPTGAASNNTWWNVVQGATEAGPPHFGSVTTPATFQTITTMPVPPLGGTITINWTVTLSGVVGASEANNYQLALLNAGLPFGGFLVQSTNAGAMGSYTQTPYTVVAPAGSGPIVLQVKGNTPTTGAIYGGTVTGVPTLTNTTTGFLNTWETLTPGNLSGSQPVNAIKEVTGLQDPLLGSLNTKNALALINTNGSTQNMWLRSVSRTPSQPLLKVLNTNPQFAGGNLTGWSGQNGATIAATQPGGSAPFSWACQVTPSIQFSFLASNSFNVVPLQNYLVSAYVFSAAGDNFQVGMNFADGNNNYAGTFQNSSGTAASTWTLIQFEFQAPVNAATATIFVKDATASPTVFLVQNHYCIPYTLAADPAQAIGDGIPIPNFENLPQFIFGQRYNPGQLVQYENTPFLAVKSSVNLSPPFFSFNSLPGEWAPLYTSSPRPRICVSGYVQGSSAVAVVPFVEWYDIHGNFISRVFARSNSPSNAALPNGLIYDGFITGYGFGSGSPLSNRTIPDSLNFSGGGGAVQWVSQTGSYANMTGSPGFVYPQNYDQRSIATVNAAASDTNVGITFLTNPPPGQSQGLALRYVSNTSYLRADMQFLKMNNNGVITTLGTYATAAQPGDRLTVNLAGSTINCYVNGVQVLTVTSTFNQTAQLFGIITETT